MVIPMKTKIRFAKVKPNAIIPSKNDEDMGLDIYACFDEDYIKIEPHQTVLVPTGLASQCNHDYGLVLKERSSTGSKGIAVRAGIIDSSYRGEIKVAITNTTSRMLYISKLNNEDTLDRAFADAKEEFTNNVQDDFDKELLEKFISILGAYQQEILEDILVYPYSKAIAQGLVMPVPEIEIEEISYEELKSIPSKRGVYGFGSTGK